MDWVRVGTSGKTIIFLFKDAAGDDKAVVKDLHPDVHPQITINGKVTISLDKPIYQKAATQWNISIGLPYVIYPLADQVLKSTDQVAAAIPDGWVDCSGGPIAGAANVAVENYVGKSLLPPPPQRYTMPIGMNLAPEGWSQIVFRSNLMRSGSFFSVFPPNADLPLGPNLLPTNTDAHPVLRILCSIRDAGDYTLMWDGAGKLSLTNHEVHCTSDQYTGGQNNKRVYNKTSIGSMGALEIRYDGADIHHIRVYPPGVKTDGSQYFNPETLRMLRGMKCIRPYGNDCCRTNISTFDEFPKDEQERHSPATVITAAITKVEPYDNADKFFAANWACMKFTTAEPHHFKTGYLVTVRSAAAATTTTGRSIKLSFDTYILVLSPTEFVAGVFDGAPHKGAETVSQAQDLTGTVEARIDHGDLWLSEAADLANSLDGCDLWWSVPYLMEDDSLHQMFAVFANRLAKGRKLHVEYGNEVWNWEYGGTPYCLGMGALDKPHLSLRQWYTKRSAEVWAIARQEFAKVGREADVRGVCACQMGGLSESLNYAKSHTITIDEIAVAPYFDVGPGCNGDSAPYINDSTKSLDVDQVCDLADINVQYNNACEREMNESQAQIKKAGFQGKFVTYEGGPEGAFFPKMDDKTAQHDSQGWSNHPRVAAWERYFLQHLQDKFGIELMNYYCLNHNYGENGKRGVMTWAVYMQWKQPDGLGDGSDGLFNNLTDLQSDQCVSVRGWALHDWIDRVAKSAAATAPAEAPH